MALENDDLLVVQKSGGGELRKVKISDVKGGSLWTEDLGKLYPTTLTNDVQVGGTSAAPNISLNADGSATFFLTEDRAYSPNGVTYGTHAVNVTDITNNGWSGFRLIADQTNAATTSAGIQAVKNSNNRADFTIVTNGAGGSTEKLRINDDGNLLIGSSSTASPNITLNADGTGAFVYTATTNDLESGLYAANKNITGGIAGKAGGIGLGAAYNSSGVTTVYSQLLGYKDNATDNDVDGGFILKVRRKGDSAPNDFSEALRVTKDRDVLIGGTLPSAPNISLNADGTASFASGTTKTLTTDIIAVGSGSGIITGIVEVQGNRAGSSTAFSVRPTDASSGPTIALNTDGSAEFSGIVNVGSFDASSTTVGGNIIYNTGGIYTQATAATADSGQWFRIYHGSTITQATQVDGSILIGPNLSSGSPNTKLNADGSAEFAGNVTTDLSFIGAGASIQNASVSTILLVGNETQNLFSVDNTGTTRIGGTLPGLPNITLNASGTASFAGGGCTIAPEGSITTPTIAFSPLGPYYSRVFNSGTCTLIGFTNGDLYLGGTLDGTFVNPQQPNIALNADDGSATFAGNITTKGALYATSDVQSGAVATSVAGQSGIKLNAAGQAILQTVSDITCLEVYNSTTSTINFNSNGSATFAGSCVFARGVGEITNSTTSDLKVFSIYNSDVGTNSFYVQADGKVTAQSFDLESLTALP